MLSLAPAARMLGWAWSTATAGSFCLLAENGLEGLPTDTSVSPPCVAAAGTAWAATTAASRLTVSNVDRIVVRMDPPVRGAGW